MINLPMPKSCQECKRLGYDRTINCQYGIGYTCVTSSHVPSNNYGCDIPQNCPLKPKRMYWLPEGCINE